ncbi:DMT family transporter [Microvirga flavescens]|uniref:DMT family transporter n=1 Tax=Microvirga flavescens TaxID=2249811 RepID=UPI0018E07CDE|nr:DMT family transporter [Microvirga flavescens]
MSKTALPFNGLLFALGSAGLYGLNIVYARVAALAGVNGPAIVVYRVLLMLGLTVGAAYLMRRHLKAEREEWRTLALLGIATAFVGLCYISSVAFIPVTMATVIFYAYPTMIVLATPFVDKTPLTPSLAGVVVISLIGVVLVVGPVFEGLDWRGLALAAGAGVATATQFFAAARCRKTDPVAKVFWVHLIVLPTALLVGALTGQLESPAILAIAPFAVFMTIGGYVIGFIFQMLALARISAAAAGIAYCIEPVVSALASVMVLGERLSSLQIGGGVLVLFAVVTNVYLESRRSTPLVPTD